MGLKSEYNIRGGITSAEHYVNGTPHGSFITYRNGRILEWSNYNMGKLHGLYRSYFEHSDQVQKEINYQDNELHGPYTFYNEAGEIILEYEYNKGKKLVVNLSDIL